MVKGGDGHRARLRQRFLAAGARAFLDHEIGEMLLAHVVPRGDTKGLAYALIEAAGEAAAPAGKRPGFGRGIAAMLRDPLLLQESGAVAGYGPGMAVHLAAARAAALRLAETGASDAPILGSWNAVGAYCRRQFGDTPAPALLVLLLDYRHRLLVSPLAFDPAQSSDALARETVQAALRHAASGVIVVRLAEAGDLAETRADEALARALRDAGAPVSVLMHDFIVAAGDEFLSLRSMGVLEVAALYDPGETADDASFGGWFAAPEERLAVLQKTVMQGDAHRLSDTELLALLLRRAVADAARALLAADLIARFGNLGRVLSAPVDELIHFLETRPAAMRPENAELAAVQIGVIGEACQRYLRGQILSAPPLSETAALVRYCRAALAYAEVEHLYALFLAADRRLLWDEVLSRGTVNTAPVHPREIASRALRLGAAGIVLVHNHPTGDPEPSQADISMTLQIEQACRAVGVTVLDHLIVAESGHISLAEAGRMPRLAADAGTYRAVAAPAAAGKHGRRRRPAFPEG